MNECADPPHEGRLMAGGTPRALPPRFPTMTAIVEVRRSLSRFDYVPLRGSISRRSRIAQASSRVAGDASFPNAT